MLDLEKAFRVAAEPALQGLQIKQAAMTPPAVVAPDRRCLVALKPIVNRIGILGTSSPRLDLSRIGLGGKVPYDADLS